MAQRRMFSKTITNSARFLKMPKEVQNLYFHLCMHADDDGVVEAFTVMQILGTEEDSVKLLAAKGFVRPLNEDLVSYIIDWNEHNLIRADRKIDSIYKELLLQVIPEVELIKPRPRADTLKLTAGRPVDVHWTTNGPHRLGKDRLGKDSIETPLNKTKKYLLNIPMEDIREFMARFEANEKQIRSKGEDLDSWCDANGKRKKDYRKFLLVALKKDFREKTEEEKKRKVTRVKTNSDGSPMIINGVVQMETVNY